MQRIAILFFLFTTFSSAFARVDYPQDCYKISKKIDAIDTSKEALCFSNEEDTLWTMTKYRIENNKNLTHKEFQGTFKKDTKKQRYYGVGEFSKTKIYLKDLKDCIELKISGASDDTVYYAKKITDYNEPEEHYYKISKKRDDIETSVEVISIYTDGQGSALDENGRKRDSWEMRKYTIQKDKLVKQEYMGFFKRDVINKKEIQFNDLSSTTRKKVSQEDLSDGSGINRITISQSPSDRGTVFYGKEFDISDLEIVENSNGEDTTIKVKEFNIPAIEFDEIFEELAKKRGVPLPDKNKIIKEALEFSTIVAEGEKTVFNMGSTKSGISWEAPVHKVTLTKPFAMQKTEVTQLQWALVMGYNPSIFKCNEGEVPYKITDDKGEKICVNYNRPVENVSWNEIQIFIEKLNKYNGQYIYRLPTEAQWEYAARKNTTTEYFWGDDEKNLTNYDWVLSNSGGRTHDVATDPNTVDNITPTNPFGLYNIYGNVREWINDYNDDAYYSLSDKWEDPQGPEKEDYAARQEKNGEGIYRGFRGGAWNSGPSDCRSAHRTGDWSSGRANFVGLRLVRTSILWDFEHEQQK